MKRKIALLALLAAFPPLSTDMYLAAMPIIAESWQQTFAAVNLTLVGFFATYCAFLLIYGPLSDRYGRRPPLLIGLALYLVSCLACTAAGNIHHLIAARILQGAGAASASAIAFAICKDLFEGSQRQRIFLQLGVIVAAAPMIAPIIGGWIIESFSWRWIFMLQAFMGSVAFAGVLVMEEPFKELNSDKLTKVFNSYLRLFSNKPFLLLTITFASTGIPFFAYIARSSDIFINGLGYSEREYGYFFGVNASAFMIAPLVFSRAARRFTLRTLLPVSYCGIALSSAFMLLSQIPQPFRFAVPMWFLTFFFSFGRPPGNNLILEQVQQDVGAASSLMVFVFFMTGAVSMWFISLDWQDTVRLTGILGLAAAIATLLGWFAVNRLFTLKFP